ncbi:uncharacterized protein LOC136081114 [Hydra vulgaris]|uniref:Uncharacterized protein LOC136081114 n=1 Tax=Hydra vulgaris TaxID=6087 RepID=A0ABM4BZ00_HYDVU
MSDTIQNEIIQMFAHSVQRSIVTYISQCSYLGLTADGTTYVAGYEQFSISIRYVGSKLKVQECFMGFYNCQNSTAEILFNVIIDVFTRCTIPMNKLVGYAFDGASNMSGHLSGVRAHLGETYPHAVYVHCANHSLDLVLQEVCFEVKMVIDTIQFVCDVETIIRESSKRKALCNALFSKFELVAKALQSPLLSALVAEKCVQLLLAQLKDLRSDAFASELHRKAIEKSTTLNLELP